MRTLREKGHKIQFLKYNFSVHANPEAYPSADLETRINEANLSRNFVLLHHHPCFTVDHTQRVSTAGSNQAASSTCTCSHRRKDSISKCKAFQFDHLKALGGVLSKSCVVPVESGSGWKAQAHSWVEKSSGLSCLLWHWRTWRGFRCTGCRRKDTWTKKKRNREMSEWWRSMDFNDWSHDIKHSHKHC